MSNGCGWTTVGLGSGGGEGAVWGLGPLVVSFYDDHCRFLLCLLHYLVDYPVSLWIIQFIEITHSVDYSLCLFSPL